MFLPAGVLLAGVLLVGVLLLGVFPMAEKEVVPAVSGFMEKVLLSSGALLEI